MPGNAFINFGKLVEKGESLQQDHHGDQGWIEISDWSWDIEAEHSVTKGTGAAVGKATPGNLSITHYYDVSSSVILRNISVGTHFPSIQIHMCKSTGKGVPETYFGVVVSEAYVTKVSTKGGEDGSMTQDVEFVFKQIYIGYKPQNNKGVLEAPIDFYWSVKGNELAVDKDFPKDKILKSK